MHTNNTLAPCTLLLQAGANDRLLSENLATAWETFEVLVRGHTLILDYQFYQTLPKRLKESTDISIIIVDDVAFPTVGEAAMIASTLSEACIRATHSKVFVSLSPFLYRKTMAANTPVAEVFIMKVDTCCKSETMLPDLRRGWHASTVLISPAQKGRPYIATFTRHWRE